MMRLATPKQLQSRGILGMNARNASYILAHNKRAFYPRVDDKMQTKELAIQAGIGVPDLICAISSNGHLKDLAGVLQGKEGFVIKPTKGAAGKGILVIIRTENEAYIKPNGDRIGLIDLKRHISEILSGLYSLGGQPDSAMIEDLIAFSDIFEGYSYQGVPDIRVIAFYGYPVMAMTRLSTAASDGKANLHQGAVGVGLSIATGKALNAVQFNQVISTHPDTGKSFDRLSIPDWEDVLLLAAKSYELTELAYIGADVVLDLKKGPIILELNARPGLAIQTANGVGIRPRLEAIETIRKESRNPEERVAWSMKMFT